ncbi:hypothetical protein [uncultured Flavobacterium sp.]|uniref:hypothetical protein n=1 Tax=uncultured Flavobacterium sp. TaxID=165435 RepID=UPI0025FA91E9|nr:hypothetical protein [uncultured Flavobacterium sp.]
MKRAFYIVNYTYFLCLVILLAFTGTFSLGSKENLVEQLTLNFWTFIFARIVFNEALLFVFLFFLFGADFIFYNVVNLKTRFQLVFRAFFWLSLFSVVFISVYFAFCR